MKRIVRVGIIPVFIAAVIGGIVIWSLLKTGSEAIILQTAPVLRSDLMATISATGTVEPVEVVDVGAQVTGRIVTLGKDRNGKTIDYGSVVEEGTVMAQIDDSLYAADADAANAQLQQTKANLISAHASVLLMKARLFLAKRNWGRAQKLGPSESLAPSAYDQYKSEYGVASANVAVAQAAVKQARASVAQAHASLNRAQRNLGYCTIKSPVKGVIIDRRVNIGQTVVSSFSTSSLFLLARDLTRVQVWVSVNEADIGNIHQGMPATFTVDAFPDQIFRGQVGKVRLNATMTQNVVTYTVEVDTDNPDGRLLPYLTANVNFIAGSRQNVLAVPNAALRWQPHVNQIAPEFRQIIKVKTTSPEQGHPPVSVPEGSARPVGTVWVEQGNFVRPFDVSIGLTDGTLTEVQGSNLAEGMHVVVGEHSPEAYHGSSSGGASPFTPQFGRSRSNAR